MLDNYGFKDWASHGLQAVPYDYDAEAKAERARELQRKIAMRTGELQYENDGSLIHDSNAMIMAKEVANASSSVADWLLEASENVIDFGQGGLLDRAQFDAENHGKRYSMSNKDFISARNTTTKQLIDDYHNAKHDPNADKGIYTLKKFDGYNADGTERFLFKTGLAEVGANGRYNFRGIAQDIQDGYEIVEEKRFAGAEEWEKTWNASEGVLDARTLDLGGVQTPDGKFMSRDKASGVNFGDGYTEILNEDLLGVDEGKTQADYDSNKAYSKRLTDMAQARYDSGLEDSVGGALASGTVSLLVDTADFVLDVITPFGDNTLLNDVKKKENIDKWVGYDRTQSTQVLNDAATNFKNGNYLEGILGVLSDPNTMAESLPMMLGMTFGTGKFTAVSKAVSVMDKAKKAGKSATEIAKLESRFVTALGKGKNGNKQVALYKKMKDNTKMMKGLDHLAKNSGFHVVVGAMTNNVLDDRISQKLEAGEEGSVDMAEVISVYATQLPLLLMDRMTFGAITGIGGGSEALKMAFKAMDKVGKANVYTKLATKAAGITAAGGFEAGQEYLQTWGEILGANVGVDGQSVGDVLSDEGQQHNALVGLAGGLGAGAQMKAATYVFTEPKEYVKDRVDPTKIATRGVKTTYPTDVETATNEEIIINVEKAVGSTVDDNGQIVEGTVTQSINSLDADNKVTPKDRATLTRLKESIKTLESKDDLTTEQKATLATSETKAKDLSDLITKNDQAPLIEKFRTNVEKLSEIVTDLESKEGELTDKDKKKIKSHNERIVVYNDKISAYETKYPPKVDEPVVEPDSVEEVDEPVVDSKPLDTIDIVNSFANKYKGVFTKADVDFEVQTIVDSYITKHTKDGGFVDPEAGKYSPETIESMLKYVPKKDLTTRRKELEEVNNLAKTEKEVREELTSMYKGKFKDVEYTEVSPKGEKPTESADEFNEGSKVTEATNKTKIEDLEAKIAKGKEDNKDVVKEEQELEVLKKTVLDDEIVSISTLVDKEFVAPKNVDKSTSKKNTVKSVLQSIVATGKKGFGGNSSVIYSTLSSTEQHTVAKNILKGLPSTGVLNVLSDAISKSKKLSTVVKKAYINVIKSQKATIKSREESTGALGAIDPNIKFDPINSNLPKEGSEGAVPKPHRKVGSITKKGKSSKQLVTDLIPDSKFIDFFKYGALSSKGTTKSALAQSRAMNQTPESDLVKSTFISNVKKAFTRGDFAKDKSSDNEAKAVRFATIALSTIIDNIKSNIDRTNEVGEKNTHVYASRQDVQKEIGRSIEASYGRTAIASKGGTDLDVTNYYNNLGRVALKVLDEAGYVDHTLDPDAGNAIIHHAEQLILNTKETDQLTEQKVKGKKLSKEDAILLNDVTVKSVGLNEDSTSLSITTDFDAMLSPIMKALLPSKKKDPTQEVQESEIVSDVNEISGNQATIIKKIQGSPLEIDNKFFDALNDIVDELGDSLVSQIDPKNKDLYWIKTFFDLHGVDSKVPFMLAEESGQVVSRNATGDAILEYIREVQDKRYLTNNEKRTVFHKYFSASNQRIHLEASTLNGQSEKIVSRYILGVTYTTKSEEENKVLITHIANVLGLTGEDIVSPGTRTVKGKDGKEALDSDGKPVIDESYKALNNLLNIYQEDGIKGLFSKDVFKAPEYQDIFDSGHSAVETASVLQGVIDIRNAIKSQDKPDWRTVKVQSSVLPEFDASTSGLVNKLLNFLGNSLIVKGKLDKDMPSRLLKRVTALTTRDQKGKFQDGYLALASEVENQLSVLQSKTSTPKIEAKIQSIKAVLSFIDSSPNLDLREVSKYPVMTNIYGQKSDSLQKGLGEELGQVILLSLIKDKDGPASTLLRTLDIDPDSVGDGSISSYKSVAMGVKDAIGKLFSTSLSILNKDISDIQTKLDGGYKQLMATRNALNEAGVSYNISLRNPYDVVAKKLGYSKDPIDRETNFSLEKRKLVAQAFGADLLGADVIPTIHKYVPNINSLGVIPLHAIDSAILLLAFEATFKALGEDVPTGNQSIHDAVLASPEFLIEYRKQYHTATLDVAEHYDIASELKLEVEYTRGLIESLGGHDLILSNLDRVIGGISKSSVERLKYKKRSLDAIRKAGTFEVFGRDTTTIPETTDVSKYGTYTTKDFGIKTESELTEGRRNIAERAAQGSQKKYTRRNKPKKLPFLSVEGSKEAYTNLRELVSSGKPYFAMDIETDFTSDNNNKEAVELYGILKIGDKEISRHHLTMLPTSQQNYTRQRLEGFIDYQTLLDTQGTTLKGTQSYSYYDANGVKQTSLTRDQKGSQEAMADFFTEMEATLSEEMGDLYVQPVIVGHNFQNFDDVILSNTSKEYYNRNYEILDTMQAYDQHKKNTVTDGSYNPRLPRDINPHPINQGAMAKEFTGEVNNNAHKAEFDVGELANIISEFAGKTKPTKEESTQEPEPKSKTLVEQFLEATTKEDKVKEANKVLDEYFEVADAEAKVYIETIKEYLGLKNKGIKINEGSEDGHGFTFKDSQVYVDGTVGSMDTKGFFKYVTHEIEHALTAEYLRKEGKKKLENQSAEYKFLINVTKKLDTAMRTKDSKNKIPFFSKFKSDGNDILGQTLASRFFYIKGFETTNEQLIEFTAIYRTNGKFRDYIAKNLFGEKLGLIERFVKSLKVILSKAITVFDPKEATNLTTQNLHHAFENIINSSVTGNPIKPKVKSKKNSKKSKAEEDIILPKFSYEVLQAVKTSIIENIEVLKVKSKVDKVSQKSLDIINSILEAETGKINLDEQIDSIIKRCD